MCRDGELLCEITVSKHFDQVVTTLDQTLRLERCHVNDGASIEHSFQIAHVDRRHDRCKRITKSALREATLNRRLTTLKVLLADVAGRTSLLALLTTTSRLAKTGTHATSDAGFLLVGPLRCLELRENIHRCYAFPTGSLPVDFFNRHQVKNFFDHAAERGSVLDDDFTARLTKSKTSQNEALMARLTRHATALSHSKMSLHGVPPPSPPPSRGARAGGAWLARRR
jgi:hypothetical protein